MVKFGGHAICRGSITEASVGSDRENDRTYTYTGQSITEGSGTAASATRTRTPSTVGTASPAAGLVVYRIAGWRSRADYTVQATHSYYPAHLSGRPDQPARMANIAEVGRASVAEYARRVG